MDHIDFENELQHYKTIKKRLSRRGLKACTYEWEVHVLHDQDFSYQVYVGPVNDTNGSEFYVAIYPRDVYYIDGPEVWSDTKAENRIFADKIDTD